MSDTEKMGISIENQINNLFRGIQDGKVTNDDFATAYLALKRGEKLLKKMIENYEKPIKESLEYQDEIILNGRKFYFDILNQKRFDADKAKAKLESLNYSLEDFTTLSTRKTLKSDYEL